VEEERKQKIEIEVDIPEGYEATGEYRRPECGECYLWDTGANIGKSCCDPEERDTPLVILRKKPWRAARGDVYWIVGSCGMVLDIEEDGNVENDEHFEFGNYFKTEEQAEAAAERVRRAYKEDK
jgi:hypothetical protein